jgi:pullulanase/glycogen debranching enzyme
MKKELNYLASKRWEKVGSQELRSTPYKQEINPWVVFHKSWAQGIKRRAQPKSGRKCKNLSAWHKCMIPNKSKNFQKDGRRAQISSVGHKLLYEIHPRCVSRHKHVRKHELRQYKLRQ